MDENALFTSTLAELRDKALLAFNLILACETNMPVPPVTDVHKKYLTTAETEAIVKDHLNEVGVGYAFGCETRGEMLEKMETVFQALVLRIRSNILAEGVQRGYLEQTFNSETGDFDFEITKKGEGFSNEQFREFFGLGADGNAADNNGDSSPENN